MSILLTAMTAVLCLAMIGAALLAISGKALPVAILAAGLVSLVASVLFLILAAPDVAMTEAAIGSGLTTFLFFFVLGRVRAGERSGDDND
ncbi:MAG: hydrogenase subunit MbhD domain-containing protein [Azonexus sp.]